MIASKVAGTLRVPSARGQRPRPLTTSRRKYQRHAERACYFVPVMCLLLTTGCGLEGPVPSRRKHDEAAVTKPAESATTGNRKPVEKPAVSKPDTEVRAAGQKPGTIREKAAVGMGEKGRGYGGDMITIPFKAYWSAKEMITLDLIKHDLDLYKAGDGQGKGPKTQEEFMAKIIKANDIKLPPLPAGQRYVYDPDKEELLVERPGLE
jgi:hypothetical protein